MSLKKLSGLETEAVERLKGAGIRTSTKLLDAAKTLRGRKELSRKTGLEAKELLRYANIADKLRVKGLGQVYAELL